MARPERPRPVPDHRVSRRATFLPDARVEGQPVARSVARVGRPKTLQAAGRAPAAGRMSAMPHGSPTCWPTA
jgi:hypothetical protein